MAEKKLLKLSDWSKGMLTAASRVDLPLDALFYAENVDFSIPLRQGLLENDAMIGDGGNLATIPEPDHNAVAGAEEFLDWRWLGGGTTITGTWEAIGMVSFAGDEYIWRSLSGVLYFKTVGTQGAWTTLSISGETFDGSKEVFSTGKNLLIPLVSGYLAAMWDHGVATLPVGNKLLTVSIKWTGDADGDQVATDYVWREITGHSAYTHMAWGCVQSHTSLAATSSEKYLPDVWDDIRDDAYDIEGWAGHPWMRYWKPIALQASKVDLYAYMLTLGVTIDDGDEWAASTAYTSPAAALVITSAASTYVYNAPSALPIEYVGHASTDTIPAVLTGGYGDYDFPTGYVYQRPDGDAIEADWYSTTEAWTVPADNGLIAEADGGGTATGFRVSFCKMGSPVPPEGVHPSIWRQSCFMVEPRWEEATTCKYYLIYEHDHGGFSKPTELIEATFEPNTSRHQAMAIEFYANLDKWSESVRRVHVFRVANPDSGDPSREAWLFSVDRAKSNWWQHKTATSNSAVFMLAPTSANPASVDVDGYPYGGPATHQKRWRLNIKGDMGISNNPQYDATVESSHASGISAAFIAAADEGIDLAPVLKGGMGIYSFVDYGQDTQETAQTILGVSLEDLLGVTSIDYTQLSFIGEALGRAFYTEGYAGHIRGPGTVWYSEVDRYSIISPLSYLAFGGSGPLFAIENLHSYLLLLFKYKTVILDARSGLDVGWSVVQELNGIGCVGPDCVTRHESQIFWMGSGSVWMWDGAGAPRRISAAIEYPGFSNDMNHSFETMWLAIDPAKKELLVYLLAKATIGYFSGWGELYFKDDLDVRGKCMVYSLGGKTWSAETFRGFRTSADQGYKYLGKPFILDNYVLIPCAKAVGAFGYLIIRQAYMQFLATGGSAHIDTIPPWKRTVLETGFLALGTLAADKKLKRLHAAFTGPLLYAGRNITINDTVLDHWDFKIYTFQEWEDTMGGAPWELLSQLTEDYNWDVSTEESESPGGEKGYHKSIYTKNDLPSRQTRYIALRLESQGTDAASVYETMVTKVEMGEIEASFTMKERR